MSPAATSTTARMMVLETSPARMALVRLADAPGWLAGPHRQDGEFVLVLGPGIEKSPALAQGERILGILLQRLPASEAAKLASKITGLPKKELYTIAVKRVK